MTEYQENEITLESYFGEPHQSQQLSHLNKKRAKRQNVTRPTNRNPQALFVGSTNDELGEKSIEAKSIRNEELQNSALKLNHEYKSRAKANSVDQPKISLEDLTTVKLRRTVNSKNKPDSQKPSLKKSETLSEDHQFLSKRTTSTRDILDLHKLSRAPQVRDMSKNRMSMFEANTYIAPEPHNPTKYLEVFDLENPKFNQELIRKPRETKLFSNNSPTQINNNVLSTSRQPKFKKFETYFAKPVITSEITNLPQSDVSKPLIIRSRIASPSLKESVKQPTVRVQTQLSVKPPLKTIEKVQPIMKQTLSPPPVKLRTKKSQPSDESIKTKPNKINKYANRFSMFEPTCQKSFNKLKLNELRPIDFENQDMRSYQKAYIEIDRQEIATSVKDRIKLFSQ